MLENLMIKTIVFYTYRQSPWYITGKIQFEHVSHNIGNAWNLSSNTFKASRSGIYIFSVSTGASIDFRTVIQVFINSAPRFQLQTFGRRTAGSDVLSRTFALALTSGDTLTTHLIEGHLFSNKNNQSSLLGYLYEPRHGLKIIWSVHRNMSCSGYRNPFTFNDILLNEGNGWNYKTNKFYVRHSGIYQLHLTATSSDGLGLNYQLMYNNKIYASILRESIDGDETRSRSIMIHASPNDTFHIAVTNQTKLYSNKYRLISFTGFLLYRV